MAGWSRYRLSPSRSRRVAGLAVTLVGIAATVVALLPVRSSIDLGATALVLLIPVVAGVAVGGFPVVPVGAIAGFLAYDFFFIPPYHTLRVGAAEHWVGLAAYAAVSLMVGGVVAQVQRARAQAEEREAEAHLLFELSQAAASHDGLDGSLRRIVALVREQFAVQTAAVLLSGEGDGGTTGEGRAGDTGGVLRVAACAGEPLPELSLRALAGRRLDRTPLELPGVVGFTAVTLQSVAGPPGVLAVAGRELDGGDRRRLAAFAGQAVLAIERARLVEETTKSQALEEVDRVRSTLMSSVSHDLRTPLASIKASVSDLADPSVGLTPADRATLLQTIEEETDRLTRFVANLLDFSRIEAGALEVHRTATPLPELVHAVAARFERRHHDRASSLTISLPPDLPLVDVDYVLIDQVLANLIENALRYCPPGTSIGVSASSVGRWVEVRVADHGPGVPAAERERIFELFYRPGGRVGGASGTGGASGVGGASGGAASGVGGAASGSGGGARGGGGGAGGGGPARPPGAGMGLAICAGIIESHGGQIWVEQTPGGGATFVFRLPSSADMPAVIDA